MKTLSKLILSLLLLGGLAFAQQNTLVQTSLSVAVPNSTTSTITVASATGITVTQSSPTLLYVDHEAMIATAISSTVVSVIRGAAGTTAAPHASGQMVLLGRPDWFYSVDPQGSCTASATYVTPYLNIQSGFEWLCSSVTGGWVPGFGNPGSSSQPIAPTVAVASAAGLITPSGPLFHITGALAITGFNIPLGFQGGQICAIPDGTYTTTTANNIALASTGVVSKQMCWNYDGAAAKPFFPSY